MEAAGVPGALADFVERSQLAGGLLQSGVPFEVGVHMTAPDIDVAPEEIAQIADAMGLDVSVVRDIAEHLAAEHAEHNRGAWQMAEWAQGPDMRPVVDMALDSGMRLLRMAADGIHDEVDPDALPLAVEFARSIPGVGWDFLRRHLPAFAVGLRVLAATVMDQRAQQVVPPPWVAPPAGRPIANGAPYRLERNLRVPLKQLHRHAWIAAQQQANEVTMPPGTQPDLDAMMLDAQDARARGEIDREGLRRRLAEIDYERNMRALNLAHTRFIDNMERAGAYVPGDEDGRTWLFSDPERDGEMVVPSWAPVDTPMPGVPGYDWGNDEDDYALFGDGGDVDGG